MKKVITIDTEDAQPGMQLALDAVDRLGVRLLTVGSILSEDIIKSLIKRNISHISIYEDIILTQEEAEKLVEKISMELDHKFKFLESFPLMNDLKLAFHKFRVRDIKIHDE